MSRWVSLNHARANASASWSGFARKRREIFSYAGSNRSARSVVSIDGAIRFDGSCACGTVPAPAPFFGCHCCAPAGLFVSSHSKPNRFSKKLLLHFVGVVVQVTSRPLVIVSAPLPVPKLFFQPRPCSSRPAASGSAPTLDAGAAPWVLPKVVAADDERDGFFVVHRHAAEGVADILGRRDRIGIAVRTFGVDVNQAHLHRGQRILQVARVDVAIRIVVGHEHGAVLRRRLRNRACSECRRRATSFRRPNRRR